jgi:16S rRNA U516 pseudouridylate synthase RsuA-like enzyme
VRRLKRIREGKLALDRTLKPGQWRELTGEEIALLKAEG